MKTNLILKLKLSILVLFMIFNANDGFSQLDGTNFDFNAYTPGNYAGWIGKQATNLSSSSTISFSSWVTFNNPATCTWTYGGSTDNCFVINSDPNAYDPIAGGTNIKKIPTGYTKSTRINCPVAGGNSNMLTYDLEVTDQNCLLTFNYAMVLEAPGHSGYENPFFQIEVVSLNMSSGAPVEAGRIDPCAFFEVIGNNNPLPAGWGTFSGGIWQNWRQISMNLTNYLGERVRIKVTLAGCEPTGHYAYGYFVGRVGPSVLNVNACGNEGNAAIVEAPSGFQSYEWYANPGDLPESQLGNIASTSTPLYQSTATATVPANNTFSLSTATYNTNGEYYFVKVTSPSSSSTVPGCVAYMKTRVQTIKPVPNFSTLIDCQLTASFTNTTFFPLEDQEGEVKQYLWDFGDGTTANYISTDLTTETNISPTHTYSTAGTYTVRLLAKYNDCEQELVQEIIIPETPSFSLIDSTICMGSTIGISIQNPAVTNNVTYTWTNPNDPNPFVGPLYTATFNQRTEIIVEAVSPSCNYKDTVIIDVQEFPDITLIGDTMLCDGETAYITATDATGNTQQMQWSFTDPGIPPQFNPNQPVTSNPIFEYTPTGDMTIYLIARTSQGCMGSKSITISITDPKAVANKYKVCPGDPVILTGLDAVNYSWTSNPADPTLPTTLSADPVTAHPQETTIYTMKGYGASGCNSERTLKVTVIPYPEAAISYSPTYVDVDNPVLSLRDISTYGVSSHWAISDGTTSESRSFSHRFNDVSGQNVEIYLTTFNELGCSDTASIIVPIELFSVWVPSGFTPDGDGSNDRFFFRSLNKLNDVKFEVYNKWGERLYLLDKEILDCSNYPDISSSLGWDGKYNGKEVPVGSYVWRLTYKRLGNERIYDKSGTINVIR